MKNKGEKALAVLVLCQRFESKTEQRAALVSLKSDPGTDKPGPENNAKSNFMDLSDDEVESSMVDLEEKEVNSCSHSRILLGSVQ